MNEGTNFGEHTIYVPNMNSEQFKRVQEFLKASEFQQMVHKGLPSGYWLRIEAKVEQTPESLIEATDVTITMQESINSVDRKETGMAPAEALYRTYIAAVKLLAEIDLEERIADFNKRYKNE